MESAFLKVRHTLIKDKIGMQFYMLARPLSEYFIQFWDLCFKKDHEKLWEVLLSAFLRVEGREDEKSGRSTICILQL